MPAMNSTELNQTWNETGENQTHIFERLTWIEFLEIHAPIALIVDRVFTPIWYFVGTAGNLVSTKIWMTRSIRKNNSSAIYLATLSITDLIFLLLHILLELKYAWGIETLGYPLVCETYFVFYLCTQYLSPFLVLGFTVERYIAVCHPFQKEKYCTTSRAIKVVIFLIMTSISLCCIQAYFWTYSSGECIVRTEAHSGTQSSLWSIWTWATEMLVFLVIPLVISVFNFLVIREVRRISHFETALIGAQKSNSTAGAATTVMLMSVSFYVICTTVPATLVYALVNQFPEGSPYLTDAQVTQDPVWSRYLFYLTGRKIIEEICLSHYACNFFLYFITGIQFRKVFIDMVKCSMQSYRAHNGAYSEVSQRNSHQHSVVTRL